MASTQPTATSAIVEQCQTRLAEREPGKKKILTSSSITASTSNVGMSLGEVSLHVKIQSAVEHCYSKDRSIIRTQRTEHKNEHAMRASYMRMNFNTIRNDVLQCHHHVQKSNFHIAAVMANLVPAQKYYYGTLFAPEPFPLHLRRQYCVVGSLLPGDCWRRIYDSLPGDRCWYAVSPHFCKRGGGVYMIVRKEERGKHRNLQ